VLAFDLHHSDLPLQVAFPLMIANLVNWLAPGSGGNLPDQVTPGSPVAVNLPLDVETAVVRRPDGTSARYETQGGRLVYPDTNQLGVYRISWGQAEEATFAVNLFLPEESRVKPAGTLALFEASDGNEAEAQGQGRREWWRPLAFASLVLLLVEWLVYQRATIVHLMSGMREVLAR
jgi:hypothetical protein